VGNPGRLADLGVVRDSLLMAAVALAASSPAVWAQEKSHGGAPAPLFGSDSTLTLTLTADFRAIAKDRDTIARNPHSAVLSYTGLDARVVALNVEVRTRGHFRLKRATCDFPPLRLTFPKAELDKTLFERQRSLKLVTHCDNKSAEYEQYVLQEYLVYRVYNRLTDLSFRARLARVTYRDLVDSSARSVKYAFFIEDDQEMAKRTGTRVAKTQGARFDDLDHDQGTLLAVFEYFIGNTDWSLPYLHNIRLVRREEGSYYPVPYDFDWSGAVNTRYAKPDPRLPIRSVRERLYRGPCRTTDELAPVFARFKQEREAIYRLYQEQPDLAGGNARSTVEYFEDFYRLLDNPGRLKEQFRVACD